MEHNDENLILSLESNKKTVYRYESKLLDFQKKMLKDEKISLFYTLKDASLELEEMICNKLTLENNRDEMTFKIQFCDKVIYDSDIDIPTINEKDIEKNEVQLYFIFEKIEKIILNKIVEEHKQLVLSSSESN